MTKVNLFSEAIMKLGEDENVVKALGLEAEKVRSRVKAPRGMTLRTRSGRGRRGAFSQVIMRGQGALAVEYGSRKNPPYAPLRRALKGGA